jgi:hypothetical protein
MREMNETYYCPVCGYDQLVEPPANHSICSCCGTHFGYHDVGHSWSELREKWLLKGAPWFSHAVPRPARWNALEQLQRLADIEAVRVSADSDVTKTTKVVIKRPLAAA